MIRRILIIVVLPAAVSLTGTVTFMLHSQIALRWLVARVQHHYAGKLSVGGVTGSLAGLITLSDVRVHAGDFDARIQRLDFDWQPLALLIRRMSINTLRADGVDVALKPSQQHQSFRFLRPQPPRLPLALVINDLQLSHIFITAPALHEPLSVDRIALAARLGNRAWLVRGLQAEGSHVRLQGNAAWSFRNREQLTTDLRWRLALPDVPLFAGELHAQGNENVVDLHGLLDEPFHLDISTKIQKLFAAPTWQGRLTFSGLDPRRLRANWLPLAARGELRLHGNPADTWLTGDLEAHEPKTGDWHARADLRLRDRQLEVQTLAVTRVATRTRFDLAGKLALVNGIVEPSLHGGWRALDLPLTGKSWLSSPTGTLVIRGAGGPIQLALDGVLANGGSFTARGALQTHLPGYPWQLRASARQFLFTLQAFNNGGPLPATDWRLQARGDMHNTVLERVTVAWLGGQINAQGRFAHDDGRDWQLTLSGTRLDPSALYPQFPGKLDFAAQLSGDPAGWQARITDISGLLRGAPVKASGTFMHAVDGWSARDIDAEVENDHLQLNGRFGQHPSFSWRLQAPQLAALWPGLSGALHSTGQVDLAVKNPLLAFTLHAQGLRYQQYVLHAMDARADMDGARLHGAASLTLDGLQLKDMRVSTFAVHAHGTLAAHALDAQLDSSLGTLAFAGSGAFANDAWQGNLTRVSAAPRGGGSWQAVAPWQPNIAYARFSLPTACLAQADARACLGAERQTGRWQAVATLDVVPVSDLAALLPEGLDYAGNFSASLHAADAGQGRILDLNASLSPGAIHNVINGRRVSLLAYTSGSAVLHADPRVTTGEVNWRLADGGYLDIRSHISHGDTPSLSGSIQGEMHGFDLVPTLIPAVGNLSGDLKMNLTLGGSPADPSFDGSAAFADGRLLIPRLGVDVTGVQLDIQGSGDHLAVDGAAHSGKGEINLHSTAVKENGAWRAQGQLDGANFRVVNIPEAQVDVSPRLSFTLNNRDLDLDGEVTIPNARLRPRDLTHTAQVSPDQVIVGEEPGSASGKWRVHTRVRAILGEDVDFDGFGLAGDITGSVLAVDEPGQLTTGSGELQIVHGSYSAFRQKLSIDRGRLLFNGGPISDPALDIRALRPPAQTESVLQGSQEQKVGVIVRGTLRQPQVSLYSDPPLPQSQLLNYLLFGQAGITQGLPAGSFSPLNGPFANQYANPLATSQGGPTSSSSQIMALSGGAFLAQQAGEEIGISDVNMSVENTQSAGASNTSLFIGKYLSPRLYVSYGVGLLQPINTVLIRYQLSTKWILEAQSGMANSADLIYTIER